MIINLPFHKELEQDFNLAMILCYNFFLLTSSINLYCPRDFKLTSFYFYYKCK